VVEQGADDVPVIVERVVGALAPQRAHQVGPADSLIDDLGYHSLRLVELSSSLEELFGLEPMTLEEAPVIKTVAQLTGFVSERIAAGEGMVPELTVVEQYLDAR